MSPAKDKIKVCPWCPAVYWHKHSCKAGRAVAKAQARVAALEALINTPAIDDFLQAVKFEAAHQCERWGTANDAGKTPADWFWVIGYLAGKALHSMISGNNHKALHHTISTAAACLNWHAHMNGLRTSMRPGIRPPKKS